MKDEGFEYLLSILPPGPDKSCALHLLPRALDFVRERDSEFGTAQIIQKALREKRNPVRSGNCWKTGSKGL